MRETMKVTWCKRLPRGKEIDEPSLKNTRYSWQNQKHFLEECGNISFPLIKDVTNLLKKSNFLMGLFLAFMKSLKRYSILQKY